MYCAMNVNCLVLLGVSLLILISVDSKIPGRSKRIIDGIPVTARDSPYDVVRYTVFIAHPGVCSKRFLDYWPYLLAINRSPCHPGPNDLSCGGALLTPKFVHTACHCLADFVSRPGTNKSYAVVRDVTENSYHIYPGQADTSRMLQYVEPMKYFVYEQCVKLAKADVLHDFGIITLKQELNWLMYQELEINYVPTLPVKKIKELFYKVLNEESTCLLVGWGFYRLSANGEMEKVASSVLIHGWRTITSINTCKHFRFYKERANAYKHIHPDYDYYRDTTTACTLPVVNETSKFGSLYSIGKGDSGSPVTCHNQYFAVVTGNMLPLTFPGGSKLRVGLVNPVAYSYYEVAYEHRERLIAEIYRWEKIEVKTINVTRPPQDELLSGSISITNPSYFSSLVMVLVILPEAYILVRIQSH